MNTILIINAISSGVAAAGIGGLIARARRRARREVAVQLIPVERRRPRR